LLKDIGVTHATLVNLTFGTESKTQSFKTTFCLTLAYQQTAGSFKEA
jgi:hypothetical protein